MDRDERGFIDFDNKSPADLNKNINIAAFLTENDDVEYKFMEGIEGIWKPIQDFSKSNIVHGNLLNQGNICNGSGKIN